jgi:hypothetical protein
MDDDSIERKRVGWSRRETEAHADSQDTDDGLSDVSETDQRAVPWEDDTGHHG